jgi:hypothetical protein
MYEVLIAYFEELEKARTAMSELHHNGYSVTLDKIERGMPDPDYSVSALMVGVLPDLANGIFGDGYRGDSPPLGDGAYLMILLDAHQSEKEAGETVLRFGGELLYRHK